MQKKVTAICMLMMALMLFPVAIFAETIYYTDDPDTRAPLQTGRLEGSGDVSNALLPGTISAPLASGNTVIVNFTPGSSITTPYYVYGGVSSADDALHNTVNILGASQVMVTIYGGKSSTGAANYNTVNIFGMAKISAQIYGGNSYSGAASYNTINVYDKAQTNQTIFGGYSLYGSTNYNTVNISGSAQIGRSVVGGYALQGSANYNTINISGSVQIKANITGGFAHFRNSHTANYNTVNIFGNPTFDAGTLIYGGSADFAIEGNGDIFTGNTLNLGVVIKVRDVGNFEFYNFILPANAGLDDYMLTTNNNYPTPNILVDLARTTITIKGIVGGGSTFNVGEAIKLMNKVTNVNQITNFRDVLTTIQGVSLIYELHLTEGSLLAVVDSVAFNKRAKAIMEGRAANLALLNQKNDLVANQGLASALSGFNKVEGEISFAPFVAMSGGRSQYDTGSHVNLNGYSVLAGVAAQLKSSAAAITLGLFAEGGWSNYDAKAYDVKADGNSDYYGGGILVRVDFAGAFVRGLYAEGSFSLGQSNVDFAADNLTDVLGNYASYESSSMYYGGHVGAGYIFAAMDKLDLDIFGKYFWAHQGADNVSVVGDPYKFKADDSHRVQTGVTVSYAITKQVHPYATLTYEYEFSGKTRAKAYNYQTASPSLKGSTVAGELGIRVNASGMLGGVNIDLGVQGFAGKRDGLAGSARLVWGF